jgi:tetratricopeptide (TPR) repeat protein
MIAHRRITATALLIAALLSGCPQINTVRTASSGPNELEALLQNRQYERALQVLDSTRPSDIESRRNRILLLINNYENVTLAEAQASVDADDLASALNRLDGALQNIPSSDLLRQYRDRIERVRDSRMQRNERQQVLNRADYVLQQRSLYAKQKLLQAPTLVQRWQLMRLEQESVSLSEDLLRNGLRILESGDPESAAKYLNLARQLHDSDEATDALRRLQYARAAQQRPAPPPRNAVRRAPGHTARTVDGITDRQQAQVQRIQAEMDKALAESDLARAHDALERLRVAGADDEDVARRQLALHHAMQSRVLDLMRQGDRYYRADAVEPALDNWREALSLDPDNDEIQARIERAEKVLARLRELKQKNLARSVN